MTRMDRFICLFITPYCHAEAAARRVFGPAWDRFLDWANPDRVVCDFANKTNEGDDE